MVRLIGDAGIGKSRLVREFLARVEDDERFAAVAVRRTACSPLGEQSFGAIGAILRSAYGIAPNDRATTMREKLAALLAELGLSPSEGAELMPLARPCPRAWRRRGRPRHVEPEQLRRQIHFAVRTLFERRLARVAVASRRRGPALGRCGLARGASLRDGPARPQPADDRADPSTRVRGRRARHQPHQPRRDPAAAPRRHDEPCADRCSVRRPVAIVAATCATASSSAPAATRSSSRRSSVA